MWNCLPHTRFGTWIMHIIEINPTWRELMLNWHWPKVSILPAKLDLRLHAVNAECIAHYIDTVQPLIQVGWQDGKLLANGMETYRAHVETHNVHYTSKLTVIFYNWGANKWHLYECRVGKQTEMWTAWHTGEVYTRSWLTSWADITQWGEHLYMSGSHPKEIICRKWEIHCFHTFSYCQGSSPSGVRK